MFFDSLRPHSCRFVRSVSNAISLLWAYNFDQSIRIIPTDDDFLETLGCGAFKYLGTGRCNNVQVYKRKFIVRSPLGNFIYLANADHFLSLHCLK